MLTTEQALAVESQTAKVLADAMAQALPSESNSAAINAALEYRAAAIAMFEEANSAASASSHATAVADGAGAAP